MRITQGTFSFLPDLTDEQIAAQIRYSLHNGWSMSVEYTDDPHPRNSYWEMWAPPVFDLDESDTEVVMREVARVPRGAPGPLRQAQRLRRGARPPDDRAQLHRRPSRRTSRATGSTAPTPMTACSATGCTRTRPTGRPGADTRTATERDVSAVLELTAAQTPTSRRSSARRTSRRCSRSSTVTSSALAPVKQRIREISALLVIDRLRRDAGPDGRRDRRCT